MKPRFLLLLLVATHLCLAGCAPSLPAAYVEHSEAARRAYAQGKYREAAAHWRAAEGAAPSQRYKDEALYRQAASLERAGESLAAQKLLGRLADAGPGERQARARFDAAYLTLDRGDTEAGMKQLKEAILEYPDSGPAIRALRTLLDHARQSAGNAGEGALIGQLLPKLARTSLHQRLLYARAQLLERSQPADAAVRAYGELIEAYPYPHGLFWDESIIARAKLLVQLGRPAEAVHSLRKMLAHREQSDFLGSYERHYADAHYLLATITRDSLGDLAAARTEFRTIAKRYTTSVLRDDALWQAMACSQRLGASAEVCADAERLVDTFPDSRFSACAHHVCNKLTAQKPCRQYVLEAWRAATTDPSAH